MIILTNFLLEKNFLDAQRRQILVNVNKMLLSYLLNGKVNALCHTQITLVLHFKFCNE